MELAREPQWRSYLGWLAVYLLITGATAFVIYAWLLQSIGRPAGLETTILMAKAVSLGALVIIGGAEIARSKDCSPLLRYTNYVVMAYTITVVILLIVKIIVSASISDGTQSWYPFKPTYEFMKHHGDFISISPLIIYAGINLVTIVYHHYYGKNADLKRMALSFFTVADLPCIVPILSVFLLATEINGAAEADQHAKAVFISGAMAMFILISNNLTIVVRYIVHPAMGLAEGVSETAGSNPVGNYGSGPGTPPHIPAKVSASGRSQKAPKS